MSSVIAVIKIVLEGLIQIATAFERNVEENLSLCRIEHFLNELDSKAAYLWPLVEPYNFYFTKYAIKRQQKTHIL